MLKEFKKSDLNNGMVVELYVRGFEKELYLVLDGKLVNESGYYELKNFNEDMEHIFVKDAYISKVYRIKNLYVISEIFKYENLELLWNK